MESKDPYLRNGTGELGFGVAPAVPGRTRPEGSFENCVTASQSEAVTSLRMTDLEAVCSPAYMVRASSS